MQSSNDKRILILCNSKHNLNKWHFHIESLLEQANVRVCDQQSIHTLQEDNTSNVFLITIQCAIENLKYLSEMVFECMAISDPLLEINETMFDQLAEISTVYKTYITGEDLTVRQYQRFSTPSCVTHKFINSLLHKFLSETIDTFV